MVLLVAHYYLNDVVNKLAMTLLWMMCIMVVVVRCENKYMKNPTPSVTSLLRCVCRLFVMCDGGVFVAIIRSTSVLFYNTMMCYFITQWRWIWFFLRKPAMIYIFSCKVCLVKCHDVQSPKTWRLYRVLSLSSYQSCVDYYLLLGTSNSEGVSAH